MHVLSVLALILGLLASGSYAGIGCTDSALLDITVSPVGSTTSDDVYIKVIPLNDFENPLLVKIKSLAESVCVDFNTEFVIRVGALTAGAQFTVSSTLQYYDGAPIIYNGQSQVLNSFTQSLKVGPRADVQAPSVSPTTSPIPGVDIFCDSPTNRLLEVEILNSAPDLEWMLTVFPNFGIYSEYRQASNATFCTYPGAYIFSMYDMDLNIVLPANFSYRVYLDKTLLYEGYGAEAVERSQVLTTHTSQPTLSPTAEPTLSPTAEPTLSPTAEPTLSPTAEPTLSPTAEPTLSPTAEPTLSPTAEPTLSPTAEPTLSPTAEPTLSPTTESSVAP